MTTPKSKPKLGWAVQIARTTGGGYFLAYGSGEGVNCQPIFQTRKSAKPFLFQLRTDGFECRIVRVRYWEPEVVKL